MKELFMKEKSSFRERAKFSRRILCSRRRIIRSPMPNEHPDCIGFALLRSVIGLKTRDRPPFQPIRYKTKTNHDLVTLVFPRLRTFTCIYFEFSLAACDVNFCSNWLL